MLSQTSYCAHCGAANPGTETTCFACQKPLQPQEEEAFLIGKRYRILDQVGSGGFGSVYKVADTQQNDALRALKQINLRTLSPQQAIEATDAFNREVALLSQLKHIHLPRVHNHFTDPEHWYLLLDFIEGETLETYLERQPHSLTATTPATFPLLSFADIFDIAFQLCDVLTYLHTRHPPIIFRDLKPANIMRTPTGELYLIDFGIARHFKPGQQRDTMPFGSPGYAAPEQYGKAQTTPASDVYSLGALLHHLLSGQDPAETPFHFESLQSYGPAGINELLALIQRMVSLDPQKRPASTAEVASELHNAASLQGIRPYYRSTRLLTGTQTISSPPTVSAGSQQQAQAQAQIQAQRQKAPSHVGRRVVVAGLALSAFAIVGGTTIGGTQHFLSSLKGLERTRGVPPALLAEKFQTGVFAPDGNSYVLLSESTMRVVTQRNELKGWISQGDHLSLGRPTWSPESNRFALADSMGNIHIWDLNHRAKSHTIPYTGTPSGPLISYLAWSPDGKYLAQGQVSAQNQGYSGRLQIVEITSGNSSEQYMGLQGRVTSLDWSPDSRYIAVGSNDGNAQVWDSKAPDKPRYTYSSEKDGKAGAKLRWSPDGQRLAITSGYGHIVLWSPFTNKRADLEPKSPSSLSDLAWSSNGEFLAALSDDGITFWDLAHSTSTFIPYVNILAVRWQDSSHQVMIVDQYNNTSTLTRPNDSSEKQ